MICTSAGDACQTVTYTRSSFCLCILVSVCVCVCVCVCVFNPLSLSLRGLAPSCSSSLSLCPWLSSLLRSACSCGVCSWPTEGRSYSLLCFGVHSFFHLPLLSTKQVSHARQSNGLPHPSLLPPCLLLRSLLMASGRLVSLHVLQPFLCMRCAFGPPWSDHVIPPHLMSACLPAPAFFRFQRRSSSAIQDTVAQANEVCSAWTCSQLFCMRCAHGQLHNFQCVPSSASFTVWPSFLCFSVRC